MPVLRTLNLSLAFVLELGALVALGYWGFRTGDTAPARWLLGIGAPLVAALVWGLFVAPKAVRPAPLPAKLLLKALVFRAAAALIVAGHTALGRAFLAVVAVNEGILLAWRE